MKITVYSITMTFLWSSLLILIFTALRRNRRFLDICSISGMMSVFLFCLIRMFVPIEMSWTKTIPSRQIYNTIVTETRREISLGDSFSLIVYQLLLIVWMIGSVVLLIRLTVKYQSAGKRLHAAAVPADQHIDGILQAIIDEEERPLRVQVMINHEISVPIGFGLIRRTIFLPDQTYTEEALRYILRHEYTHFKNHDLIVKMMTNILCALYWWDPFVYLLRKDLEEIFEMRCDQAVANNLSDKELADYLQTLLDVFRGRRGLAASTHDVGVLGSQEDIYHTLRERFEILSDRSKRTAKHHGKALIIIITGMILVCSYSFIFQPAYECPVEEIEDRPGAHALDFSDSYIIRDADGNYWIHCSDGAELQIPENDALWGIEVGFPLVDEMEVMQ